jgi:hypothetical protein
VFAGGANAQRFADIGHAMQMAATSSGDTRASYLAMAVYLCTGVSPHRVTEEGARESVNAWVDQMTAAKSQAEPCDCSTCALGGRLACRHEGPTPEAMAFFIAWRDGGKNLGACPDWEPTW